MAWGTGQAGTGERVKITMFMGNSGVAQPAGVDPSNNWAINIIEELANVDLELKIPTCNDFPTTMQLLLVSGNLPDVIHAWQLADMIKAADAGAFLDLKHFYDKPAQAKKVISQLALGLTMDQTKTKKHWAIASCSRHSLVTREEIHAGHTSLHCPCDKLRTEKTDLWRTRHPLSPKTAAERLLCGKRLITSKKLSWYVFFAPLASEITSSKLKRSKKTISCLPHLLSGFAVYRAFCQPRSPVYGVIDKIPVLRLGRRAYQRCGITAVVPAQDGGCGDLQGRGLHPREQALPRRAGGLVYTWYPTASEEA